VSPYGRVQEELAGRRPTSTARLRVDGEILRMVLRSSGVCHRRGTATPRIVQPEGLWSAYRAWACDGPGTSTRTWPLTSRQLMDCAVPIVTVAASRVSSLV
jgi:hypothetical protein